MTRIRAVVAATALCLTASLGLSGCATEGDYHHAAAERLQERVLGATAAAANHRKKGCRSVSTFSPDVVRRPPSCRADPV